MYTIGTAGHVDHGKSTLVHALTGIDPDRLREEKERGLTIDLGFAWFALPDGREVSIVDVPGHERFIKNMLAGVGGIDLALLVVAADEGVMPQTREHLAILDLLGVRHGVIALTKADVVDADFLGLARSETEELLRGTTLEGAPIVACSGASGQGLGELVATLTEALTETPARIDSGRARLPIDRVFSAPGFGTVVTGTLVGGSLSVGEEVEVIPGGVASRIRGLQSHGSKMQVAAPGRRTAVNLTGLAVDDLRRGMVVTRSGWLRPTTAVDVRLRVVKHIARPVRHNLEVTFHTGSSETEAKLLLLDADELKPGAWGWAQLRLASPVACLRGDRFIVRDPNDTLGGGAIVDTQVRRHRRFHPPTIAALTLLEAGRPEETLLAAVKSGEPVELSVAMASAGLAEVLAVEAALNLFKDGTLVSLDGAAPSLTSFVCTVDGFETLTNSACAAVTAYHAEWPLRVGVSLGELRSRLKLSPRAFDAVVGRWVEQERISIRSTYVALPAHQQAPDERQQEQAATFLDELSANPFSPSPSHPIDSELLAYLEESGQVVCVGYGLAFSSAAYRQMVEQIVTHLRAHDTITLAETRDMFSTSRKYAQALLEHLDGEHITRRAGDSRVLQKRG